METSVTLSKVEYDQLREFKRKYEEQFELLNSDKPLLIKIHKDYHGDEVLKVFSGKVAVEDLFLRYNERVDKHQQQLKDIEDRYKEDSDKLKQIRRILD